MFELFEDTEELVDENNYRELNRYSPRDYESIEFLDISINLKKLYRYDDDPLTNKWSFRLFYISKETPQGYWIYDAFINDGKPKWISKTAHKKYAHPTEKEAKYAYFRRKVAQKRILKKQLSRINYIVNALFKEYEDIESDRNNRDFIKTNEMDI